MGRDGAQAVEADPSLLILAGSDGSFSLWSQAFGEGFHSERGALREARETFLAPSELERFQPGERLRVVEVCVGTATNLAVLLEACAARRIVLEWWGLELDPRPLGLALMAPEFRRPWQAPTLLALEQLRQQGHWQGGAASGRMLWGDARQSLVELLWQQRGQVDLVWHDAFSPRRCPQLWTVEFLGGATQLLAANGRWISYCSAAAVRQALQREGLQVRALERQGAAPAGQNAWSAGTLASPGALGPSPLWRELTEMERDHLGSSAGEPYRDPSGRADADTIFNHRLARQAAAVASGARASSSAWRRRWGVRRGRG